MIGFYDYTVLLTYGSLISAMLGILICMDGQGHPFIGVFFLMISGLCDAFDGKVARTKKNRTIQEMRYGIQIDSLADLVAFGVLPACIGNSMLRVLPSMPEVSRVHLNRMTAWPFVSIFYTIMAIYVLAALLSFQYIIPYDITPLYFVAMLIVSCLFVMPLPVRKPGTRAILVMIAVGGIDFIVMLWLYIMKLR